MHQNEYKHVYVWSSGSLDRYSLLSLNNTRWRKSLTRLCRCSSIYYFRCIRCYKLRSKFLLSHFCQLVFDGLDNRFVTFRRLWHSLYPVNH